MKKELQNIIDLFEALHPDKQIELITELNGIVGLGDKVAKYCAYHQTAFGTNVTFEVSVKGNDVIVIINTRVGQYRGIGKNQKIAKYNAVLEAEKGWSALKQK